MKARLELDIAAQPTDTTCGPTCLHAVYRYYGLDLELSDVVDAVPTLEGGGTLAVLLAVDALRRGFDARIYTFDLQAFDPTWFASPGVDLCDKLRRQKAVKGHHKLQTSADAYLEFLDRGGEVRLEDLTPALIRKWLTRGNPILTGLSATYLYRKMREYGPNDDDDDLRGEPAGHFVVLCGYDREERRVLVADPLEDNPPFRTRQYEVPVERVLCAILLGVLTYDGNLLIVRPQRERSAPAKDLP